MKSSLNKALGFGITSGIITIMGLMVGLNASTNSTIAVIGGILMIAIADSLSDSLGIHVSEECDGTSHKHIWESTIYTFITKFVMACSFLIPVFLLDLNTAIMVSIVWGFIAIFMFTLWMSLKNKTKPLWPICEHMVIAIFVVIVADLVGNWVATLG